MKLIGSKLKQFNHESIFTSCMIILLGILILIFPKSITNILSYLIGVVLILMGIFKIYYYFKYEGKYDALNYDLSYGILNIILGILCLVFKDELQSVFRIIIGLIVIYEGIISISLAHKVCYVDKTMGIVSIILSILMVFCGGFIVVTKGIVITTIGIVLIVFAIINIVDSIIFNRNLNKLEKYLSKKS